MTKLVLEQVSKITHCNLEEHKTLVGFQLKHASTMTSTSFHLKCQVSIVESVFCKIENTCCGLSNNNCSFRITPFS